MAIWHSNSVQVTRSWQVDILTERKIQDFTGCNRTDTGEPSPADALESTTKKMNTKLKTLRGLVKQSFKGSNDIILFFFTFNLYLPFTEIVTKDLETVWTCAKLQYEVNK